MDNGKLKKKHSPTIKEVAQKAGVTTAVVSRVFNNDETLNIKDETRNNVLKAIKELQYRPNTVARSLRTGATNTIGMLISDINNPFYTHIIRGVQAAAEEAGFCIMLCDTRDSDEIEKKYINMFKEQFVKGVILCSVFVVDSIIKQLEDSEIKYVMVNRITTDANVPYVRTDDVKGQSDAVKYLAGLGHKKIAHISGPFYADTSMKRIQGYSAALRELGIQYDSRYLVEASLFEEQEGYDACKKLLQLPKEDIPTAITAANDLLAIGAMRAIHEAGFKIPDDISLVGYNDIWVSKLLYPPLTTVHSPLCEMGRKAFELLYSMLNGEENIEKRNVFTTDLVIRESTCPCQSK